MFYIYVGYLNGICTKYYYEDYITLPLILSLVNELAYNLYIYVFRFLIRGRLIILYYLRELMIPEIILGMVLMAFFYMLNLPFGMLTLLIGHTVFCVPYILMEVKARLVGMDPSLEEAARDLGAGSFRAFWDITLPLIMPAVISGSLLAFAMSMDDVVISIFVTGPRVSTLPIKVYTQMKTGVTPEINALCTIMLGVILLVLAVYLIAGKRGKGNIKDEQ